MEVIVKSSFFLSSYPYVYTYPLAISPVNLSVTRYDKHGNSRRRSCCPCLSYGRNGIRRSNDLYNHDPWLSSLYGYEHSMILGNRHFQYQVIQASKQAGREDENYGKVEGYTQEEQRWIREEQRWLREEQRWLREETRWNAERDSLLHQISHLTLRIQELESELEGFRNHVGSNSTVPETLSKISSLLQVLNSYTASISASSSMNSIQNQISEYSEEITKRLVLEDTESETEIHETITPPAPDLTPAPTPTMNPESKTKADDEQKKKQKSLASSLRMGSEGEEVQALQEALMSLGFYSGEEDMEHSSFSSGTQRAVKTWQASIGAPEDGIMTSELLEKLYAIADKSGSSVNADQNMILTKQDGTNGVPTGFVAEVGEVQQTVVKEGQTDFYVSHHRVYLLGENRWEEPSRLTKQNDKKVNGDTTGASATKCLACRGEGRLLCMECDGTGEPNVEPQFMEWVEEGAKCPYCEGLGYTVCDVCEGKAIA